MKKVSKNKLTAEIAFSTLSRTWSTYPSAGLNPHRLTQIFKEADVGNMYRQSELFEEMEEKDSRLGSLLQTRRKAAASKEFEIKPGGDDAKSNQIADFVEENLRNLVDLEDDLEDMLSATGRGFSGTQIIWEITNSNRVHVKDLVHTPQKHFRLDDTNPNKLRIITRDSGYQGIDLPENKFIVIRDRSRAGHMNRAGLLRPLSWLYLFKNFSMKYWMIFAEIFGIPFRLGKYQDGADEATQEKILRAVRAIAHDTAGIIPASAEIEFIQAAKASGEGPHERLVNYINKEMSIVILGHSAAAEATPGKLGGETNAENVRQDLLKSDCRTLSNAIRWQLIKPLVDFNFGEQPVYPSLKFLVGPNENTKEEAEKDKTVISLGLPVSKKQMYQKYKLNPPEDEDDTLVMNNNSFGGFDQVAMKDQPRDLFTQHSNGHSLHQYRVRTRSSMQYAISRKKRIDHLVKLLKEQGVKPYRSLKKELENQIDQWIVLEQVHSLDVPNEIIDDMASSLFNNSMKAYMFGASEMIGKVRNVGIDDLKDFEATGLSMEGAGSWFASKMSVDPSFFTNIADEVKQNYFTVSRIETINLINKIKAKVKHAIDVGQTVSEFREGMDLIFQQLGIDSLNPWHVDLVYQQNISTAYSAGFMDQWSNPEVLQEFPLAEYDALMDNTRPEHADMDGAILDLSNPDHQRWLPPNGFNCHCVLKPINRTEIRSRNLRASDIPVRNGDRILPDPGFQASPSSAFRNLGTIVEANYVQ